MCAAPVSHGAAGSGIEARSQKNPWHSSNGPVAGPLARRPRETAAATGNGIERGRGALGAGRPSRCRARGLLIVPPVSPPASRAGLSCPALAVGRIPAPATALSPWPLGGRFGPSPRGGLAVVAGGAGLWGCLMAALRGRRVRVAVLPVVRVARRGGVARLPRGVAVAAGRLRSASLLAFLRSRGCGGVGRVWVGGVGWVAV